MSPEGGPAPETGDRARGFRAAVEYDGTDFFGWQVQPGRRTVQGEIERAIAAVTGERVRVTGAGRTDRGVHATGQVASFDLATRIDVPPLLRALNAKLPRDAAISGLLPAPAGWSARRFATSRTYHYRIARRRDPVGRRFAWEMWAALDVARMRRASERLLGENDFSSFAVSLPPEKNRVIRLREISWREEEDRLEAVVVADRFLRGLVRRLVGTLVWVGRGAWSEEDVSAALAARDPRRGGPSAPARGLTLVAVTYPEEERDKPTGIR